VVKLADVGGARWPEAETEAAGVETSRRREFEEHAGGKDGFDTFSLIGHRDPQLDRWRDAQLDLRPTAGHLMAIRQNYWPITCCIRLASASTTASPASIRDVAHVAVDRSGTHRRQRRSTMSTISSAAVRPGNCRAHARTSSMSFDETRL